MNIKEHIEAGHYPTDEKGRALVPTEVPGYEAVIAATDAPGEWCLQGWVRERTGPDASQASWLANGGRGSLEAISLLPPPPRKVPVTRWAVYSQGGTFVQSYMTECEARHACNCGVPAYQLVELTGEREEPWS